MKIPQPPPRYDPGFQRLLHNALELADEANRKKQSDVDIYPGRLILRSPNGTRFEVRVANDGTLSAVTLAPGAI